MEINNNIFSRAKIFIEDMDEFAPFGAKLVEGKIKDVVFYNDKSETLNTGEALKIIQENLIKELNNKETMSATEALATVTNDKELTKITKGITAYHQQNGVSHNVFMDPKDTGGQGVSVAIGGTKEFINLIVKGAVKSDGLLGTASAGIQYLVDKYYAGDSERSIGRTAVIK